MSNWIAKVNLKVKLETKYCNNLTHVYWHNPKKSFIICCIGLYRVFRQNGVLKVHIANSNNDTYLPKYLYTSIIVQIVQWTDFEDGVIFSYTKSVANFVVLTNTLYMITFLGFWLIFDTTVKTLRLAESLKTKKLAKWG